MSYLVIFMELIIGFIGLFITVKYLGKTQISQITAEYAIFENNGSLSVLKKFEGDFPINKDLNINGKNKAIPYTLISDGKILVENLKVAGLDEVWLQKKLETLGVKHPKEICYAEWQAGKELYFQKY